MMILLSLLFACVTQGYREAKVRVADDVNVIPGQIMSLLPPADAGSNTSLEFIVTDFSSGVEIIRITDQGITESTKDGHIRILVMVRVDNSLKKSFVIECSGQDKDIIMLELKKKLEERFATKTRG